jgi:PIN domain nuclease of toxin-antitoxin system
LKRYLADTHAILWFSGGEARRLGRRARRVFDGLGDGRCAVLVSVVSVWEIALLHDDGAIRLPAGFSAWCDALASVEGMRIESLVVEDVEQARTLRGLVDPHDRLIAGTALRLNVELITADRRIRGDRRVRTLW